MYGFIGDGMIVDNEQGQIIQRLAGENDLIVCRESLRPFYGHFLKRTFDIVFSLLVLATIFPVFYLIFGVLIKWSSPGPVLFRQRRSGLYGREFNCYKFRTMRLNEESDVAQTVRDDPRRTPVGAFLRHRSLDEFPQFINVLLGDMSVVGPRPHMLIHTTHYAALIHTYMDRLLVRPGVTGWAQVTGFRGEIKRLEQMEGRVKRDMWYIDNWSFLLDLKIIVMTVINMLKGEKDVY